MANNLVCADANFIVRLVNIQIANSAFELVNQFNLPASYDAHYLALAQHLNCDFYTGDKRLSRFYTVY